MKIHYQQTGSGPSLVLLHGWGLNLHVWSGLTTQFSQTHCVVAVDLPGHGGSDMPAHNNYQLDEVADAVASVLDQGSILLGWSLGGLIAQQLTLRHPALVQRLILVASSPRFARGADWPQGMDPDTLADFATQLEQDYRAMVQRFLALQAMGSEHAREEIRFLREALLQAREPNPAALRGGLQLLQHCDLRAQVGDIHCPTLIINGERDRLVSPHTGTALSQAMPHARNVVIKGAGHAPFLSHADTFIQLIERFIHAD
jgi:pimeloyl-[acyl-carrier protein] methyl ester esterase